MVKLAERIAHLPCLPTEQRPRLIAAVLALVEGVREVAKVVTTSMGS